VFLQNYRGLGIIGFEVIFSIENSMEYVHGFMDWVHDNAVHQLTDFIKPEPSKSRWMAQIYRANGMLVF
jgi:hypothetical protein